MSAREATGKAASSGTGKVLPMIRPVVGVILAAIVVTWVVRSWTPGQVAAAAALLLLLGWLQWLAKDHAGAWLLGILLLVTAPALLLLATDRSTGDLRSALESLVFVYAAGAMGGLVLELLSGKLYWLEMPSRPRRAPKKVQGPTGSAVPAEAAHVDPADAAAGSAAKAATDAAAKAAAKAAEKAAEKAEGEAEGGFAPHGLRLDVGFMGRMFAGGLAAVVFTILFAVLVDEADLLALTSMREPDNLAWAIVAGAVSPMVWENVGGLAQSRLGRIQALLDQAADNAAVVATPEAVKKGTVMAAVAAAAPAQLITPDTVDALVAARSVGEVTAAINTDAGLKGLQASLADSVPVDVSALAAAHKVSALLEAAKYEATR